MVEQMSLFNHDGWSLKTCQDYSVPMAEKTLGASLKKPRGSKMKMPLFLDMRTGSGLLADSSWETDIRLLGEYMTRNFGVFLNAENAYVYSLISTVNPPEEYCLNCGEKPLTEKPTKLSDILEEDADPKYNLSAKACEGILRRADKRGKALPDVLREALENQVMHSQD